MPIILGSTPTNEYPTNLANGVRECFFNASSLANITAPAPSHIPYFQFIYLYKYIL